MKSTSITPSSGTVTCSLWCGVAIVGAIASFAVAGCEQQDAPEIVPTIGQSSLQLTSPAQPPPSLPLSGMVQFDESADSGTTFSTLDVHFTSTGNAVDVSIDVLGEQYFTSRLTHNGSQLDSDPDISPFTLYLDALPNRSSGIQLGDTWETSLPAAYTARIEADRHQDVASYHAERVVTVEDIYALTAEVSIVRVSFEEYSKRTSTPALEMAGLPTARTHVQRVGVIDVAVGTGGTFAGRFLPIRVASIAPENGAHIAPGSSYATIEAAPHDGVSSCAKHVPGLPSIALSSIPSGGNLPVPALFTNCP